MNYPDVPDPTYRYDEARLREVPAPAGPEDFAEFWKQTYAEALAIPTKTTRRQIKGGRNDFDVFEIEYDSLGGFRTGGWLTVPKEGPVEHGLVFGHGYGGREGPEYQEGAVSLAPCARGFHRSSNWRLPNDSARHVLHGIEKRETYIHRGCAAELWGAATVLIELFPDIAPRLHYAGASFGGGIGALALPWDPRFRKAYLDVPSFGNHPLRVQLPCLGSGEAVRQRYLKHPGVLDVLAYFDSATAARHVRQPVLVAAALYDPAVPPPGQFAVYNALPGPKELFIKQRGHAESPTEMSEMRELITRLHRWWRT